MPPLPRREKKEQNGFGMVEKSYGGRRFPHLLKCQSLLSSFPHKMKQNMSPTMPNVNACQMSVPSSFFLLSCLQERMARQGHRHIIPFSRNQTRELEWLGRRQEEEKAEPPLLSSSQLPPPPPLPAREKASSPRREGIGAPGKEGMSSGKKKE